MSFYNNESYSTISARGEKILNIIDGIKCGESIILNNDIMKFKITRIKIYYKIENLTVGGLPGWCVDISNHFHFIKGALCKKKIMFILIKAGYNIYDLI